MLPSLGLNVLEMGPGLVLKPGAQYDKLGNGLQIFLMPERKIKRGVGNINSFI